MNDKILVFYNNKNYDIITILSPNDTKIDIDDFIRGRLKYDNKCEGLTSDDISYSIGDKAEYDKTLRDCCDGGNISIDRETKEIIIICESKDLITFDNIETAYEFHIEHNTKVLSKIYNIEHLNATEIFIDEENYSEEISNIDSNNYFDTRNFDDLVEDIRLNGMYFPLFGYYLENKFIVTEGIHRAKAIQSIGGQYMCISLEDGSPFETANSELNEDLYLYEYVGNNSFIKKRMNTLGESKIVYVSNNIKMGNTIFNYPQQFKPYYMINNVINVDRLLSQDFIKRNKLHYSLSKDSIQELYNKFLYNKNALNVEWKHINDLNIEALEGKEISVIESLDPFIASMDNEELKNSIISDGMMYPFVIYNKNGQYYVAEGYHRYQALKEYNVNCRVECITCDLDKIYYRYPSYAEDMQMDLYIPKNVFPYQEYPYVPGLSGFTILEENDLWYKIQVTNKTQMIQAYKLLPMVLKHMINFLNIRHGEKIIYSSIEVL